MTPIDTRAFSFNQLRKILKGKRVKVTYGNLKLTKKGMVQDVSDYGLVLDNGVLKITPDISVRIYRH